MPYIGKPRKLLPTWQAEFDNFSESICSENKCEYCTNPSGITECKTSCIHPGAPHNAEESHYEPDDYADYVMKNIRDMCKSVGGFAP